MSEIEKLSLIVKLVASHWEHIDNTVIFDLLF